jgi:hypothetical protein
MMSARYKSGVVLTSLSLSLIFLIDSSIIGFVGWLWWIPLVIGYIWLCVKSPVVHLSPHWRFIVAFGCGVMMMLIALVYDDILTIYLCGVTILFGFLAARYLDPDSVISSSRFQITVMVLVTISLLILPVSINRVIVKLPNLSAGTYLTLYDSIKKDADLSAQFFNRIDDHHELTVSLGSQWYFQQPHQAPRLRIDILREKIVVRILSIRYDARLAFLHLPLFEISGDSLSVLEAVEPGAPYRLQMEQNNLLVDRLEPGKPAWIQLPHMDDHTLSVWDHAKVLLVRALLWLMVCFGMISWAPVVWKRRV